VTGGLIFGLSRLRSSTFIGIRINAAMQVADVNGIWRLLPTLENRKVGGSTPPWPLYFTREGRISSSFLRASSQFSATVFICGAWREWVAVGVLAVINM
jgi:hypothetical protein